MVKSVAVKVPNSQTKRRISLPKRKPPMIDISSPNKLALNTAKRRMSPERDGWDTEKRTYTAKTPDMKKRKLDVAEDAETKDSSQNAES